MSRSYAYYKSAFQNIPRPFAFVDLDLLNENLQAITAAAGGKRIRIASKSIRSVELLRRILTTNDVFQGVMCFTATEAVYLARQGLDDLLLGYPVWRPDAVRQLVDLVADGRTIVFMLDALEQIEHLERVARERGVQVPVCLDVDMSTNYPGLHFGVWRSPIASWRDARPVVERIAASDWLRLDGVMGYEAQIAGLGDRLPHKAVKNFTVSQLKRRSIREVAARRSEIVQGITDMGLKLRFVNAGGTGSLQSSREEPFVTEITVGSGFYSPALFDYYSSFRYQPAAGFAIEVVRRPRSDIVTCAGGGYVASGAAGADKLPVPYLPEGLRLLPLEGAGEVQTPLQHSGRTQLAVGDPVFFRHAKAGELCERFQKLHAVSSGAVVGTYETYRGAGECFL
jgi:D-serine deaminase-like pyridoxal phosphate-dependent protein